MKKSFLLIGLAFAMLSCNKDNANVTESKTAYIDTSKLLKEYNKAKDLENKYKTKSEEMSKELQVQVKQFQDDVADFQKNAQSRGQAWAQQRGTELQKREQELQYKQQALMQTLQQESGTEMDSLVSNVKSFIKDFGKQKGYSYIYGTGETVSILYAKDEYNITAEVIKLLNDKYTSSSKTETTIASPTTQEKKK